MRSSNGAFRCTIFRSLELSGASRWVRRWRLQACWLVDVSTRTLRLSWSFVSKFSLLKWKIIHITYFVCYHGFFGNYNLKMILTSCVELKPKIFLFNCQQDCVTLFKSRTPFFHQLRGCFNYLFKTSIHL